MTPAGVRGRTPPGRAAGTLEHGPIWSDEQHRWTRPARSRAVRGALAGSCFLSRPSDIRWTQLYRLEPAFDAGPAGLACAGRTGARMARVFGVSATAARVATAVRGLAEVGGAVLRLVDVDDYATCQGCVHGTAVVDCRTRRLVDLLPGREVSSLAEW